MLQEYLESQHFDLNKTKRVLSVVVALVVWGLSMRFSVSGFGSGISKDEMWLGWTLAIIITIIELIWNSSKDKTNLTIWVAGVICYIYGIGTNILGILSWQGHNLEEAFQNPTYLIFPIVLGLFFEILPEPLFVLGVTGDHTQGDFLGNLFGNKMFSNKVTSQKSNTSSKTQNRTHEYKPTQNQRQENKPKYQPQFADRPNSNKNKQENNQRPQQNNHKQPISPVFAKDYKKEPSYDNQESGRFLRMAQEKNKRGFGETTYPYEHSGDDKPDW